jgi:hypothetical protein
MGREERKWFGISEKRLKIVVNDGGGGRHRAAAEAVR